MACDVCRAETCDTCHGCGAPLDEWQRCSAGPCWEAREFKFEQIKRADWLAVRGMRGRLE